ncbi:MAG: hypothetical protein ABSE63_18565 [Thermoguttaceae bacterium]
MASCIAATAAANAADNGSASGAGNIKKDGYSTVKSSGKLKWLPYNLESGDAEDGVIQTGHVVRSSPAEPASNSRQSASAAFEDPFGDKRSTVASDSAEEIGAPLILPSAGTGSTAVLPNIRSMTKSAGPKSPVVLQKDSGVQLKANDVKDQNVGGQTLEQMLASQNPDLKEGCLSVKDLKKISQLTINITPSAGELPKDCPWGGEPFQPRCWSSITFTWTASALCHHPLYFEQVQVERYGHTLGPWLQPFGSAAHFFLMIPILPYKMGLEVPDECMYTLGYYRPGDCAPYMIDPLPLSIRAGLFEAGAWVAGAAIVP